MINRCTKLTLAGLATLASITATAPASATTFVLDFSGNVCDGVMGKCDSGAAISSSYGDHQGVDVSYRSVEASGRTYKDALNYWASGFGDLEGVVWGGSGSTSSEITLTAAPGYEIALLSFDFATYLGRFANSPVEITSLDGTLILSGLLSTNPGSHNHVDVASAFFTDGIRLRWGPNGYDVGMDNIAFEVRALPGTAVPEPSTWMMMIAGFGLAGASFRRRRHKSGVLALSALENRHNDRAGA